MSTAEAKYVALASAGQEAIWMRQLSKDMNTFVQEPIKDGQSTICMAQNPQFHERGKHIGIKYHFICEQVNSNVIQLRYYQTENMVADILTTELSQEKFIKLKPVD